MTELTIRKASPEDLALLRPIAISTFTEAFAQFNSPENMKLYVDKNFSEQQLTHELLHPESAFYLAQIGAKVIGYMKVNVGAAQNELKEANSLELERIYVIKEFWGKGVANELCEYAINLAREMQKEFLWLGVWDQNFRAIRFYQKHGFAEFDKHTFILGTDVQTDLMMKRQLL